MSVRKKQVCEVPDRPRASPAATRKQASAGAADREERVRKARSELGPRLPQIDPHDLHLILDQMLRPPAERGIFLRKRGAGYDF
jgi:hypothetical protein